MNILGGIIPLNVARFLDFVANALKEELLDADESDIRPLNIGNELVLAFIFFIFTRQTFLKVMQFQTFRELLDNGGQWSGKCCGQVCYLAMPNVLK